jgi:hypothetical protein
LFLNRIERVSLNLTLTNFSKTGSGELQERVVKKIIRVLDDGDLKKRLNLAMRNAKYNKKKSIEENLSVERRVFFSKKTKYWEDRVAGLRDGISESNAGNVSECNSADELWSQTMASINESAATVDVMMAAMTSLAPRKKQKVGASSTALAHWNFGLMSSLQVQRHNRNRKSYKRLKQVKNVHKKAKKGRCRYSEMSPEKQRIKLKRNTKHKKKVSIRLIVKNQRLMRLVSENEKKRQIAVLHAYDNRKILSGTKKRLVIT